MPMTDLTTKRPWHLYNPDGAVQILGQDDAPIADVMDGTFAMVPDEERAWANGELIVHAVEQHEPLLAQLEALWDYIRDLLPCADDCECLVHSTAQAIADAYQLRPWVFDQPMMFGKPQYIIVYASTEGQAVAMARACAERTHGHIDTWRAWDGKLVRGAMLGDILIEGVNK
jgi:hypothetical protein